MTCSSKAAGSRQSQLQMVAARQRQTLVFSVLLPLESPLEEILEIGFSMHKQCRILPSAE